ncbi:hypothetical protein AVEN_115186-1 [Araneus ventricosus]|uniref:Uncharacterized protein n=1 Tax=Araneus ventricosus TaxID=182803 RepID=A0A4Y1ZYL1_ARAVE|nr:hypothetical protein AVEN_115186-1 [Araneus ventricosus]
MDEISLFRERKQNLFCISILRRQLSAQASKVNSANGNRVSFKLSSFVCRSSQWSRSLTTGRSVLLPVLALKRSSAQDKRQSWGYPIYLIQPSIFVPRTEPCFS